MGPGRGVDAVLTPDLQLCNDHYMTAAANDAPITAWFTGRLPDSWTAAGAPTVTVDREEIHVILSTTPPELADDADDASRTEAIEGRIAGFREDTREQRMAIAREAEHRFDRKVAWGVRVGDRAVLFTHLAVPVMTRLRQPERLVLDTLVGAGVARSRSDALAWCVRLVNKHSEAWLADLRARSPTSSGSAPTAPISPPIDHPVALKHLPLGRALPTLMGVRVGGPTSPISHDRRLSPWPRS